MSATAELPIKVPRPEVTSEQVEGFCRYLKDCSGWITAHQISTNLGISDRRCRALAEHSDGRVISGQFGYRYLDRTTPIEEVDHAASWLEQQAKKMLGRANAIRRRYHRYAQP